MLALISCIFSPVVERQATEFAALLVLGVQISKPSNSSMLFSGKLFDFPGEQRNFRSSFFVGVWFEVLLEDDVPPNDSDAERTDFRVGVEFDVVVALFNGLFLNISKNTRKSNCSNQAEQLLGGW